jgi:hypothetical protein
MQEKNDENDANDGNDEIRGGIECRVNRRNKSAFNAA